VYKASARFLFSTHRSLRVLAALACALVLPLALQTPAGAQGAAAGATGAQQPAPPAVGGIEATLEECITAELAEQRAVAFSGEMTAVPGTMRMAMRVDLQERAPGELEFHTVTSPGLGVWRPSDPKVKVYKYLKQVTNLSAPAAYRGFVHFRWLSAKGRVIKRADRLTGKCLQPAAPGEAGEVGSGLGGAGTTSAGTASSSA